MIIIKTIIIVATRTKLVMLASLIFSCTLGTFYTALETLNRERERQVMKILHTNTIPQITEAECRKFYKTLNHGLFRNMY